LSCQYGKRESMEKGLVGSGIIGAYQFSQILAIRIQDIEGYLPTALLHKSLYDHHDDTLRINSLMYLCFTVVTSVNHEDQVIFPFDQ
jgi:hypothetical protein